MRWLFLSMIVITLGLATAPPMATAQSAGSLELGFDLGAEIWIWDEEGVDNFVSFGVPGGGTWIFSPQKIRIGYFATNTFGLEFPIGFNMVSFGEGTDSQWSLGAGAFGVFNFPGETGVIPFLRFGGLVNYLSGGFFDDEGDAQFSAAAGGGIRAPLAQMLSVRLGATVERTFGDEEGDGLPAHWDIQFDVGLSFFTPGKPTAP